MAKVKCDCYFCEKGMFHPERHKFYHRISHQLMVPESLDPKDSVPVEACETCGHKRIAEEA